MRFSQFFGSVGTKLVLLFIPELIFLEESRKLLGYKAIAVPDAGLGEL